MRKEMYGVLEKAFGPAVRSREGCDWWILPRDGKRAVHLCLNSPHDSVAHVLIFDPDPLTKEFVIDLSARSEEEAREILKRIAAVVPKAALGKLGHDGHDGHDGDDGKAAGPRRPS